MNKNITCWCGNTDLSPFSDEYLLCKQCNTLVLKEWGDENVFSVQQDDQDFYGKQYWFEHQEADLGFGNILTRARSDLPERVLHWLHTFLKYKTPPGATLELGCSHGGFVAVLQWAGFQANGLEMSPWVVEFAHQTFQVPMLLGELEKQDLPAASLDVIVLMDVLEHLPNPSATMSRCLELLKPDGILLIQTPHYQEGMIYQELLADQEPFLQMLQSPEHVYLFSQSSVTELFQRLGASHLSFEPAFFSQYDMFLAVSRSPLKTNTQEQIEHALMNTPGGRLILALLDKDARYVKRINAKWQEAESDREARLQVILRQGQEYSELQNKYTRATQLLFSQAETRLYRFVRRVGLWSWVEQAMLSLGVKVS